MSSSDTHTKLLAFLISALSRTVQTEMAVNVELEYAPRNGYRRDMLKRWTREAEPEYFQTDDTAGADPNTGGGPSNMAFVEALTSEILELAENHADGFGEGRHAFMVRVRQHYGTRLTHRFVVLPSFDSDDAADERALLAPEGGAGASKIEAPSTTGLVGQLMRHLETKDRNTDKLIQTFMQAVGHQANALRDENTDLRRQLAEKDRQHLEHLKEIEAARSVEHDRQIEAQRVVGAEERKTFAVKRAAALLPVIASRVLSPPPKEGEAPKPPTEHPSTLAQLVQRLFLGLKPEQMATIGTALAPEQLLVLAEIKRVITQDGDSPVLSQMMGELSGTFSEEQLTSILTALDEMQRPIFVRIVQLSQPARTAGERKAPASEQPQAAQE